MSPPCTSKDDKLTDNNHTHWKFHKGLWDTFQGTEEKLERPIPASTRKWTQAQQDDFVEELEELEDKEAKVLLAIVHCPSPEVTLVVQTLSSAHAVQFILEDLDSSIRAITLQGQLYNIQFPTAGSMQGFLMKAKGIHDHLLEISAALTSSQLASLILTKLPPKYMVAQALRSQLTKDKLDFDNLSSLILEDERVLISQGKLKHLSIGASDQALKGDNTKKKRRPQCFACGKKCHLSRDCPRRRTNHPR